VRKIDGVLTLSLVFPLLSEDRSALAYPPFFSPLRDIGYVLFLSGIVP